MKTILLFFLFFLLKTQSFLSVFPRRFDFTSSLGCVNCKKLSDEELDLVITSIENDERRSLPTLTPINHLLNQSNNWFRMNTVEVSTKYETKINSKFNTHLSLKYIIIIINHYLATRTHVWDQITSTAIHMQPTGKYWVDPESPGT